MKINKQTVKDVVFFAILFGLFLLSGLDLSVFGI